MYVRNLEERVKPEPLKAALQTIFSEFGNVIDIVAKTNLKAKGQAFVVYDSAEAARQAIEEADGFDLFGKPMQVALARSRSDATVQRFEDEEALELHKRRRTAEKGKCKAGREVCAAIFLFALADGCVSLFWDWGLSLVSWLTCDCAFKRGRRPSRPSSSASSVLPRTRVVVRPRLPGEPASRLLVLLLPPWFPTSTCPRTRSCSSRTFQTTATSRPSLASSTASRASARFVWSLVGAESRSWSTRTRRVPSAPRRTLRACSSMVARTSRSRTRDSREGMQVGVEAKSQWLFKEYVLCS